MGRIVVVGGGYAGVLAAIRAGHRIGRRGEVVLVSKRDVLLERIRLHETAASGRDPARPLAELLRGTGVRVVHAACDGVDLEERALACGGDRIPFDRLIVAIGSVIAEDAIPGQRAHALTLEADGAPAIHARLGALGEGARLAVVGGGLTGLEAATELAERHPRLRVSLTSGGAIGERLSRGALAHVRRALARLAIEVREGARVERIDEGALVISGERVPFDLCVAATGFRAPDALRGWGFPVEADGRARVDACLRLAGAPHVYVAGDCAAIDGAIGSPVPAGCKTAMPMGAHAAENAVRSLSSRAELPFDWVDLGWCVSLGRRDGVVQVMGPSGAPRDGLFFAGAAAAWVKELVCRYTVKSLELERDRVLEHRWRRARSRALPALAPASSRGSA